MALLTGEAIRVGTHSGYGQSENRPRGITGFMDQNLFVLGAANRRLIRMTDIEDGTSEFASAQFNNPVHSLSEHDGDIYFTIHEVLWRVSPPFTATTTATELGVIATDVSIRSLETDGTHLFGYDKSNGKIWQITLAPSSLSAVEYATVEYPSGVTNPNIDGLLYWDGRWYVMDRGSEVLYILPETFSQGDTVQATRVGNHTGFGASIGAPLGAAHFDSKAYMIDDGTDGLYRLYETINFDDTTIDDLSFEVGTAVDVTLPEVEGDASGTVNYTLTPALPADLSFNATTRKITGNPTEAAAQTEYTYTATDDDGSVELKFNITVTAVTPVWKPANQRVGSITAGEASRAFNIASLVDDEASITAVSGIPSWGSFDGTELVLRNIPDTDTVQEITISFNATNDAGTTPGDFVLTWNPLEVEWDANLAETIGPNVTKAINILALAANADTVEATSALESWMSFDGTALDLTDPPELSRDTDYTISFRARRGGQDWVPADFVLTVREAMLPTWVIAAQRVGSVTAGDVRVVINIAAMVDDETDIEALSGVPSWGSFDGTELILEDVPDTDTIETITISFRATNDDGSRDADFVLTWNPLLVVWVHASRRMRSLAGGSSGVDIDITQLVPNADTIEVMSGLERFMNFFGQVLEVRNVPRVTEDTTYTIRFRAKRGGQGWIEADFVLTITVVVTFARAEDLRKTIPSGATRDIHLTEIVENQDELEVVSGLENWMAFSEGILEITRAPIVTETIDFQLRLRARRDMGTWVEADYLLTLRPNTYLPPNATQLERDFEAALARREIILFDGANRFPRDTYVPARNVWNPDKIASPLLPYLANAMSVDVWDDTWADDTKRQVIKDSYLVHSKKGTVQSIRDLLNSLGFTIAVINEGDHNSWANYSITLNYTITIAQGQAIITALESVAPIRSTLTGLYVQSSSHIYDGSIRYDGSFSYGNVIQLI